MENRVFFDSNFFIALLNKDDALHARAVALLQQLHESGNVTPVTSNFIINEVITVLSQRVSKTTALAFAHFIYHRSSMHIITVDRAVELKGVEYLKTLKSKNISFCDCTIFAILELFNIRYLATFDRDFNIKSSRFRVLT